MIEEIDWKQEPLDSADFNGKQEIILKNGAPSMVEPWILGALHTRWKKLKGIRSDPEPPNCNSSFQEWNKNVEDVQK
jgi:hypothetical protein